MHSTSWLPRRGMLLMMLMGFWGLPTMASGQEGTPWGMHMMWGNWSTVMMIMMLLFWAAVIVALVFFIRWLIRSGRHSERRAPNAPPLDNALDILKKRYARGEISKQEFDDMRRTLQE